MKLVCEIEALSDVEHVKQIYAGFSLLHRAGYLDLRQVIPKEALENRSDPDRWTNYKFFNVKATLNGSVRVLYDLHDWNWIDEEILSQVDFYFKRGFDREYVADLKEGGKVFPLGLNYPVSTDHIDWFKLQRSRLYSGKDRIKAVAKALRLDRLGLGAGEAERLENLEGAPDFGAEPRILFMARLWDPGAIESKEQGDQVRAINEVRAECVRLLRKEFGQRFFGGLARDEFSLRHYTDCVLADTGLSNKRAYLKTLAGFPVCVATTGLSRSNGWKLAEYVAFSKAIITEPLVYEVPGDFSVGANYLEFLTPAGLAEAATRLFEDRALRSEMMTNNYRYYRDHVRPDAIVRNSLSLALSGTGRLPE
jgi:hypothetical protein